VAIAAGIEICKLGLTTLNEMLQLNAQLACIEMEAGNCSLCFLFSHIHAQDTPTQIPGKVQTALFCLGCYPGIISIKILK
jgi:hypothetical protein